MTINNLIPGKILCVEDDADTHELLAFVFEQANRQVEICPPAECADRLRAERFAAVIFDNHFQGVKGANLCREIRSFDRTTPIVFFSGEARLAEIDEALAAGANDYLVKPNDFERLVPTVVKLIEESRSRANS